MGRVRGRSGYVLRGREKSGEGGNDATTRRTLDLARVLGRDEVAGRVAPADGPDRGVVRLEDRLKVEGQAVPERKLARLGAGQHPPAFGRPLLAVRKTAGGVGAERELTRRHQSQSRASGRFKDREAGAGGKGGEGDGTLTTLTGERILLIDEWTNFSASDVLELVG